MRGGRSKKGNVAFGKCSAGKRGEKANRGATPGLCRNGRARGRENSKKKKGVQGPREDPYTHEKWGKREGSETKKRYHEREIGRVIRRRLWEIVFATKIVGVRQKREEEKIRTLKKEEARFEKRWSEKKGDCSTGIPGTASLEKGKE